MDVDLQEEVVHCPSCKEEVPKTLYCLNCGHPLYKEGDKEEYQDEFDDTVDEAEKVTPEPSVDKELIVEKSPEPSVTETNVISPSEEVEMEADIIEEVSPAPTEEIAAPPESVTSQEEVEPATVAEEAQIEGPVQEPYVQPESTVTPEPSQAESLHVEERVEELPPEPVIFEEKAEIVEVPSEPCVEEESVCIDEKPPQPEMVLHEEQFNEVVEEKPVQPEVAEQEAKPDEVIEEKVVEVERMVEMPVEQSKKMEPDPLVREVMENVAKNLSLKVKLVKLLQEGSLKESTFNKLFESYSAQGERWLSRRSEIIERNRYDLGNMEKAIAEAKVSLEELEIRRAIGDATEEEYAAKSPAYRWDIDCLGDKLQKGKDEIAYLEDLRHVMAVEKTQELKTIADNSNQYLDSLVESGNVNSETASKIRMALTEALELLKSQT